MHQILEYINDLLPSDKKQRNNGWIYFNCPSCHHTEQPDKKHRGNILFTSEGFIYSCFNCKFKCGFHLGQYFSKNTIQWLKDLGITQKQLSELLDMVKKYNEENEPSDNKDKETPIIKREIRKIPNNYHLIQESLYKGTNNKILNKIKWYIDNRSPRLLNWSEIYWAEGQENFLIPCYENEQVVGYSLRMLKDNVPNKYIHFIPQGYIFNYDNLYKDRDYEIITEGQLDALAINGISILSNEFTPDRLKRILPFTENKEIILLPDRDKAGKKMVEQLLEEDLPFSVAFPNWELGIKDAFDAVKKYGRLYTIYSIISSKESNKDKIKFKSLKWFNIGR